MKAKKPVTRKGQTKPYHKSTLAEGHERIELARNLLCTGATRFVIHKAMRENYGVVWQTAERYMRHARKLLLDEAGKDRNEARADAIGFYMRMLSDPKASVSDKIKARTRLDDIYGIDAPRKQEISGPQGGKIELEHKVKEDFDFESYHRLCQQFLGVDPENGSEEPLHPARSNGEAGVVSGTNGH